MHFAYKHTTVIYILKIMFKKFHVFRPFIWTLFTVKLSAWFLLYRWSTFTRDNCDFFSQYLFVHICTILIIIEIIYVTCKDLFLYIFNHYSCLKVVSGTLKREKKMTSSTVRFLWFINNSSGVGTKRRESTKDICTHWLVAVHNSLVKSLSI